MDSATQFRGYADECQRMAHSTGDKDDRVFWTEMAERWLICSRLAEIRRDEKPARSQHGRR